MTTESINFVVSECSDIPNEEKYERYLYLEILMGHTDHTSEVSPQHNLWLRQCWFKLGES
jgi:hypothetical protein